MMKMPRSVTVVCLLLLGSSEALRILVAFPMASKSHNILGHALVNHLLEAGHEVVHLTVIPRDKQEPNLKTILIPQIISFLSQEDAEFSKKFILKNLVGPINLANNLSAFNYLLIYHETFLKGENISNFLSNPKEQFDAVILEWFFTDVLAGIAPLFKCPLIWFSTTEPHWQLLKLITDIPNPAYNVDVFSPYTPPLTFWERVTELWMLLKKTAMSRFVLTPREKAFYDSYYPSIAAKREVPLPSYDEAVYNGSLMLLNSHPSYGASFNLPPNVIYIGGYHIDSKVEPLSEELQKLMDNSEHGVIYFSMGSVLRSTDMTREMWGSIMKMFAKFKQTIIWKFESELKNVPKNIHLVKWAPQLSILSHSNLKVFITHGGQLSTTEAVHFGVPVIGIPVFGDQYVNMAAVERKGFGIRLNLADDIAEQMSVAIKKMLSSPLYKLRAKELSQIYHDRPVSPGKELVHWVEHVVRTRGAPHLRSPALMLPWYQKCYLDLFALIILIVISIGFIVKRLKLKLMKSKSLKKQKRN